VEKERKKKRGRRYEYGNGKLPRGKFLPG